MVRYMIYINCISSILTKSLDRNEKNIIRINFGEPIKLLISQLVFSFSHLCLVQNQSQDNGYKYDTKCATLGQLAAEKLVKL